METEIEFVPGGSVTSPQGFCAGATGAGIKKKDDDRLDLGIIFSEEPCAAAALFTANRIQAAPVVLSRQRLESGRAVAVVANSGCANACTGEEGLADAAAVADAAARSMGVSPEDVLVASTGVIGERLPMERIISGIDDIVLSADGGHAFTRAIMTTDTVPKETAVEVRAGDVSFVIGGTAKGSGMIHPNMATLLCFLTTDAAAEPDFLRAALKKAADVSFNMVSIDGDTSTNDMLLIMANGRAGNSPVKQGSREASVFQQALEKVCLRLAKSIARDGEGATRLIEVTVSGAPGTDEARMAARTVVGSPLVKSAVHGNDPNWGRIMAAVGRSGVNVVESKIDLSIGNNRIINSGRQLPVDRTSLVKALQSEEVLITLNLNLGAATATAWGCDLSEEYVTINSEYTT